jgi:peroxiredoxin Q/BCP
MTLNIGDLAPDFTLQDTEGNTVTLSELRGKRVVLYFYPKDDTPGCTKEACGFRDNYTAYQDKDILVYGISKDDAKSHAKFTDKFQLPFPLLCDTDTTVAKAYESYGLKKFMGKEYEGTFRHTFVIDPEGNLEKIYLKVKAEQHATDILADLGLA